MPVCPNMQLMGIWALPLINLETMNHVAVSVSQPPPPPPPQAFVHTYLLGLT